MSDSKKPETTSAIDALLPASIGTATYGGKKYDIKPLGIGEVLRIVQAIAPELAFAANAYQANVKKQVTPAEAIIATLEMLRPEKLYEVLSIVLGITAEEAAAGYRTADMLEVVSIVLEVEDMEKLFFQASRIAKIAQKHLPQEEAKKKTAQGLTDSSQASSSSEANTDGATKKS